MAFRQVKHLSSAAVAAGWVICICGAAAAFAAFPPERMQDWELHPAGAVNAIVGTVPNVATPALSITPGERLSARSPIFSVEPNRAYRLVGRIRTQRGGNGFSFNLLWRDGAGRYFDQDFAGVLPLVNGDWESYAVELTAPARARQAQIQFATPPQTACELADVTLTPIAQREPRLSIDLMCDPLSAESGAPTELAVRIENRGDGLLEDLQGAIQLPTGLRCEPEPRFAVPQLGYAEAQAFSWALSGIPQRAEDRIECRITARLSRAAVKFSGSTRPFVTVAHERSTPTTALASPAPPGMPIQLGCFYFPVMLDWERQGWGVRHVDALRPMLGFYDERLPQVADWHIAWAVTHGISYFVFDWYYNKGMDFLNDALEQGFLASRFCGQMQFCIDWCNEGHCGQFKLVDFQDAALESFIRALCQRYFSRQNYLRIDGRPVVFVHVPVALANDRGGWDGCRAGLTLMRSIARQYGHSGVYFVAIQNNYPYLLDYARGGFDAAAPYAYGFAGVSRDPQTRSIPYAALMPRHQDDFTIAHREAQRRRLAYIPTAWVGWNDAARNRRAFTHTAGNTPAAFRRMLDLLPEHVEAGPRLALIEAWNEWGEGGQIEPERQYGFGRLSAIRDGLTTQRGPYSVPVPPSSEVARFESRLRYDDVLLEYERRYARKIGLTGAPLDLTFASANELYLHPEHAIIDTRISGGRQSGLAIGPNPILSSPPMLGLAATSVAAVEIRLKAQTAAQIQLCWRNASTEEWTAAHSAQHTLRTDGQFHDYVFPLSGRSDWQGVVYQFRIALTNAAGRFEIARFRTIAAGR